MSDDHFDAPDPLKPMREALLQDEDAPSETDIAHFVPYLLIRMGGAISEDQVPRKFWPAIERVANAVGHKTGMGPEELRARVLEYYEANPVHPELLAALEAALEIENTKSVSPEQGRALLAFTGETNDPVPTGQKKPQEGPPSFLRVLVDAKKKR